MYNVSKWKTMNGNAQEGLTKKAEVKGYSHRESKLEALKAQSRISWVRGRIDLKFK